MRRAVSRLGQTFAAKSVDGQQRELWSRRVGEEAPMGGQESRQRARKKHTSRLRSLVSAHKGSQVQVSARRKNRVTSRLQKSWY